MARIARTDMKSNFFHVMVQGNNRADIFNSNKLKEKYLTLMLEKQEKFNVMLVAYCIMNSHVHLLIYTNEILEMSKYMQSLNQSYSQYYNKLNERVGTLFRNRFQSEQILNQMYLKNCISYIHNNPVKAGICKSLEGYKYSSYSQYINKTGIVTEKLINLIFIDKDNYHEKVKLLHQKSGNFIDCVTTENPNILLKKYIEENNIKYDMIKNNEILILEIASMLKENLGLSIRKISEVLEIDRRKIKRILE